MKLNQYGKYNILKLKRLGVLVPFMMEAKKRFESLDNREFRGIINMPSGHDIINFGLVWRNTKEGWDFWNKKKRPI